MSLRRLIFPLLSALLGQAAIAGANSAPVILFQADVPALEPGAAVEREIVRGAAHSYLIKLAEGQYLVLAAEQLGINIIVKFYGPDGQQLIQVNNNRTTQGFERVHWVADTQGQYLLEVHSVDKNAQSGRYRLKIEDLRKAAEQDKKRVDAERLYAEAILLHVQSAAESRREAIKKYESALPIFKSLGDRPKEGLALVNAAQVYSALSDWQKAIQYASESLTIFRSLGNRRNEAVALVEIANAYKQLGDIQKALEYSFEALQLSRSAGDAFREASALTSIGNLYSALGDLQKSLEYYNQALAICRKIDDRRTEALTLTNIGNTHQLLSQPEEGLRHSFRALDIQRDIGDRTGEGTTLHNIGAFYYDLGELERALEFSNRALELRTAGGDRRGSAITMTNIASAYIDLGRHQEALEYANRALELSLSISNPRGEAFALDMVGRIYQALDQVGKAAEHYTKAVLIRRSMGDRHTEALSLNNLGSAYRALGEVQKAHDSHARAMALAQEVGDRSGEAAALLGLARVELDRGNFTGAKAQSQNALSIIESLRVKVRSPELRASYLAHHQDAYKFYIDLLMRMHRSHPTEGHAFAALEAFERGRARSLLETLAEARTDIRQGVDPELLNRERGLQQQINSKAERHTHLLNNRRAEEAEKLRKELESLLAEYQQLRAQMRIHSPRYAALTQPQPLSLNEIQQEFDPDTLLLEYSLGEEQSFLWAVASNSVTSYMLPKRAEVEAAARQVYDLLTARNKRVADETPQQRLARVAQATGEYPKAAVRLSQMLLAPVAAQLKKKRLLIVGDGALQYIPFAALPAPTAQGSGIRGQGPGKEKASLSSVAGAQGSKDVSNIHPTKPMISGPRPPAPDTRPLILDHEIVSLPSASVLAVLRRELAGRKPAQKAVAVLADPVFERDDPRINPNPTVARKDSKEPSLASAGEPETAPEVERSAKESGVMSFTRLRFSRQEADAIAALVPGAKSLKATDFEASRATAIGSEIGQYGIVHFATHVLLNSRHPELSGVVLSMVDEQGRARDGFLRLHEIYNLKLGADLVVLSACQTALGKEIKGEGLIGLTRGFMYAGAPRVVASLWKVDDRATAELMKRFYQGMIGKGLATAAALRSAQVEMWKEKGWEDPFYWGGFVLQGEWK